MKPAPILQYRVKKYSKMSYFKIERMTMLKCNTGIALKCRFVLIKNGLEKLLLDYSQITAFKRAKTLNMRLLLRGS